MKSLLRIHYIGTFTAFLFVIVAGVLLWRAETLLQARKARVLDVRDQLASYEQNKKTFAEESKTLETIRSRVQALEADVVTTATVPDTLSHLEALAKSDGVAFSITNVQNGQSDSSQPSGLTIDFTANGSFAALSMFINHVLSQPYQVNFVRFALSAASKSDTTPSIVSSTGTGSAPTVGSGSGWNLIAGIQVISFNPQ
ncbi:MAG TPA: type 4a pilus biogenesis protein PilO [Candidatus Paceibacterota bacterium]|nr:type 4a pilus biogenesis protein PilO [Candidatus Paceibacterota bacterium]